MEKVISEVMQQVSKTGSAINQLKNVLQEFTDSYNSQNATVEERTTVRIFDDLLDKLEDMNGIIEFYKKPVTAKGKLQQKSNGRYTIGDNVEITCGATVEILCDRWQEGAEWFKTRIEYKNGEYYAIDYPHNLDGVMARIRW